MLPPRGFNTRGLLSISLGVARDDASGRGDEHLMAGGARSAACRTRDLLLLASFALGLAGCAALQPKLDAFWARRAPAANDDAALYRSAAAARAARFERELARLHADLEQAEQHLLGIESGLGSMHTRAAAVSAIADARISLERAQWRAPWRTEDADRARLKLVDAEHQLDAGHIDSAALFAARAARVASDLDAEAAEVERNADADFVDAPRVNLRAGPSTAHRVVEVLIAATPVFSERLDGEWLLVRTVTGRVGWIHGTLVRRQSR